MRLCLASAFVAAAAMASHLNNSSGVIVEGPFPQDLHGSNFTYPFPIKLFRFSSQNQPLEMAFMDLAPTPSLKRQKVAVLLHGKNFCAATWGETASVLQAQGYRVILPDQVGFCKSSKPRDYQFSLPQLALNTFSLLHALNITESDEVTIVGHSLGGMLAIRFTLLYPDMATNLVLTNPIGLEDYLAEGVPYLDISAHLASEAETNYASIKAYEQATYYQGDWIEDYDVWARMLSAVYAGSEREAFLEAQARVVDMVLTQPVANDVSRVKTKRGVLLVVGTKDTTAIGKQWSPPNVAKRLGKFNALGKATQTKIANCTLVEFEDSGHAPQIQDPERFNGALLKWLKR
ncbi:Alpha/Beta hydrolase protein [Podospora australis]|uniref:Alpha/Beta hydrolase protein n=1 Tax=Podospora australis TaxID=1536484 RepID=A0AAN6WUR6_9PEZI|nr:Alpha/Beta hydrolase protein [Podospora australis]